MATKVVSLTESNSGFKKAGLRLKNFSFILFKVNYLQKLHTEDFL
ncbi:hypothetical protein FM120_23990 [Sphingobacterium faecium PCAi_F2.5]|nr:hypothetical protein FM120_23990 [Sphingobacterium faecium PCAi_F2.5]